MFSFLKSKSDLPLIKLIKVSPDGFFIDENKINNSFSKKDFIKILGNPDRNETVNGIPCFIYDKIGLSIFFNDDETINRFGIDFEWREMKHSPKQFFLGNVEISDLIVNPQENEKSFESSLSSNNIDFINDEISIEIHVSSFIVEPYFHSTNENITSIQITINEEISIKSESFNFDSNNLSFSLNLLETNRYKVLIEFIEEYSGSYQTENNLSSGYIDNYEFDEQFCPENSITDGVFDNNRKVYRRFYTKKILFELDIDLFIKKLKDFVNSNNENDLESFNDWIGLNDYSFIDQFIDEDKFESTMLEEKISDKDGNIIVYDDYESFDGLSFKLIFNDK